MNTHLFVFAIAAVNVISSFTDVSDTRKGLYMATAWILIGIGFVVLKLDQITHPKHVQTATEKSAAQASMSENDVTS